MRPNFQQISVRFMLKNCVKFQFVQIWLSLDAHKFSKSLTNCVKHTTNFSNDSEVLWWELSTNFSKESHRILISVRCPHRHMYLPTSNTCLHTHAHTHTSSYMHTTYKQHPPGPQVVGAAPPWKSLISLTSANQLNLTHSQKKKLSKWCNSSK